MRGLAVVVMILCHTFNSFMRMDLRDSGAYELYFASYKDTNADSEYELQGTLVATVGGGLDLLNLNLSANAALTANVTATAVLP